MANQAKGDPRQITRQSLESTERGLSLFLTSLERARLAEALPGYQQLAKVVSGQRAWASANRAAELDVLFRNVSRVARQLHAVFAGYEAAFAELCSIELDRSSGEAGPTRGTDAARPGAVSHEEGQVIVDILQSGPLSAQRLAREPAKLGQAAELLVERGLLVRRGRGKSVSYRLGEKLIEALSGHLEAGGGP